jgi:hypothetical protein
LLRLDGIHPRPASDAVMQFLSHRPLPRSCRREVAVTHRRRQLTERTLAVAPGARPLQGSFAGVSRVQFDVEPLEPDDDD